MVDVAEGTAGKGVSEDLEAVVTMTTPENSLVVVAVVVSALLLILSNELACDG